MSTYIQLYTKLYDVICDVTPDYICHILGVPAPLHPLGENSLGNGANDRNRKMLVRLLRILTTGGVLCDVDRNGWILCGCERARWHFGWNGWNFDRHC